MSQVRQNEAALATAPIGRLMLKLALPSIAAQVINMLYNIVDRIYIGHIPVVGQTALTGVGVTFPIITLVSALPPSPARGARRWPPSSWEPVSGRTRSAFWATPPPCCSSWRRC